MVSSSESVNKRYAYDRLAQLSAKHRWLMLVFLNGLTYSQILLAWRLFASLGRYYPQTVALSLRRNQGYPSTRLYYIRWLLNSRPMISFMFYLISYRYSFKAFNLRRIPLPFFAHDDPLYNMLLYISLDSH